MGIGTTSGRIGANVSRHLENKYGKKGSDRISGYFGLAFSAVLFFAYFVVLPQIAVNDLVSKQVEFTSLDYKNHRSSDEVVFKTNLHQYSIQQWVWKEVYSAEKFWKDLNREKQALESLGMEMNATIWLENPTSTSILGIKTNTVSITPELGVKATNHNRWFLLLSGYITLGLSAYSLFKSR